MALEENGANSMVMPVAPMYGGGFGNNGGMFGGDSWAWIILLLLLGWGNNGWGNGYGGGNGGGFGGLYPWMNQADTVNNGFRDQAFATTLGGIQSGIQNLSTQTANGFSNNGMSMMQGFNQLGTQLASCCCENRLASANLQSVVQSENCADRQALSDGIRDVIASQTAGFQSIKDQLCQDKIDAKNDEIANLRTQINMMNLANSQGVQTAQLIADNNAQTAQLIQRIAPYPVPSWTVPNPYAYANTGCGCGCNA